MIKKSCYIYLLIFTFFSCDSFIVKKENQEKVLEEKWNEIDKNQVDEPPLFEACEHMSEEEQKSCFQETINKHISKHLADHTITVKEAINDTVWVPILITKNSEIILEDFSVPEMIQSQIPDFRVLIQESIQSLPRVDAAHTRGTPTSARYKLPVVIKID
ncbi:hypothetical protein ACWGOQ_0016335 [Aquimarina sp. M1]